MTTAFLARYCTGFDSFRRYLLGPSDGVAKDAAWAAAITGIPADTIRDLARRAAAARTLITCAWSLQRAHHGEQPFWAAIALAAMLGGIGLPGGGFAFGHGSIERRRQAAHRRAGARSAAAGSIPRRPSIPVARIADMLLDPGGAYDFNGRHETYPDIRLVYWAGGNPFHHHQDLNRLQRAWQKPETIVVHESWWNADRAPCRHRAARHHFARAQRHRRLVARPFMLAMHRAIEPVGRARNDFDIFRALAARAGLRAGLHRRPRRDGLVQWVYDTRARERRRQGRRRCRVSSNSGPRASSRCRCPSATIVLFEDFRRDPERHPLNTPSGRIEISSEAIAGFGYDDCPPHPAWFPPAEWLGSAAARALAAPPGHASAGRQAAQPDGSGTGVARARKIAGREPVRINPHGRGCGAASATATWCGCSTAAAPASPARCSMPT